MRSSEFALAFLALLFGVSTVVLAFHYLETKAELYDETHTLATCGGMKVEFRATFSETLEYTIENNCTIHH